MVEFLDFVEDMELIDLHLEGGSYTWFKGDNHVIASRIERILVSKEWNDLFSNMKSRLLSKDILESIS